MPKYNVMKNDNFVNKSPAIDIFPVGDSIHELFKPIILFANAQLEANHTEEAEDLLAECWNPFGGVIFDFPDWYYHHKAPIPKMTLSLMDHFMMTNDSTIERVFKNGIKAGRSLKAIKTRGIKELLEFQKKLKKVLKSMLKPNVSDPLKNNWPKGMVDAWFHSKPILGELKYFPYAKDGFPQINYPSFLFVFKNYDGYFKYLLGQIDNQEVIHRFKLCEQCGNLFFRKTNRDSKFCKRECGWAFHNERRIESGEAKKYMKRKRRDEGKYK